MSEEGPLFFSEPWGFLIADQTKPLSEPPTVISGAGTPRVVVSVDYGFEWGSGLGAAPPSGFVFRWRNKVFMGGHVPLSHKPSPERETLRVLWKSRVHGREALLEQTDVLMRAADSDDQSSADAERQAVLIDWLVHTFQELGHDSLQAGDAKIGGVVRRSWDHAARLWMRPDTNEPRMELIIKLAQDTALLQALESISANPRRILLRKREQTPISRVKEMDAACIRNYARLPGASAIQKAGSRQVLLAIQREASFSTLENRVTCWTLEALRHRAERWKRVQARHARESARAKSVRSLAKHSAKFRLNPNFEAVQSGGLSHPIEANYPLMMESRYRRVYRAYRELLRYQRIKDEAWTWRRVLWSQGVSQMVSCALREIFKEGFGSSPYYRTESDRGRWLTPPCTPGPFKTPAGDAYLIDVHDLNASQFALITRGPRTRDQSVLESIGAFGADLVFWWPESGTVMPIWALLWTGTDTGWRSSLDRAADAMRRFSTEMRDHNLEVRVPRGLVLGTSPSRDDFDLQARGDTAHQVVGIPFPMEVDTQNEANFKAMIDNLKAALQLAMDLRR